MSKQGLDSVYRERAMDSAERLFGRRGYNAVTLRDIGTDLGLSHASLYYHFPGGKEELFVAVTERNIHRHGEALRQVIEDYCCNIRARLLGIARWLLSQPPLDLIRMSESDMPALDPAKAAALMYQMHQQILVRLQSVLEEAHEDGEIRCHNPGLVGASLLGMIESFHSMPEIAVQESRESMAAHMIDILLRGMDYRGATPRSNYFFY
jgi:AcrR family transcriptional regulator